MYANFFYLNGVLESKDTPTYIITNINYVIIQKDNLPHYYSLMSKNILI